MAGRDEPSFSKTTGRDAPPHDRTFEVAAVVAGEELARGSGKSKKDAEQAAASDALDTLPDA